MTRHPPPLQQMGAMERNLYLTLIRYGYISSTRANYFASTDGPDPL
jgi:hypothetical protein